MVSRSARTRILSLGGVLVLAVVVTLVLAFGSSSTSYYLALGDSLAVGIQPTRTGAQLKTDRGYVDDIYAHYAREIPHLKLVQMGCPGDDTGNVISGSGNDVGAEAYHCDRQGGSQLKAAVAFLRAHGAHVRLISIDIGANDINDCLNPTVYRRGVSYTVACIDQGVRSIAVNMPTILDALKAAAAPGTALVGGTLYDPFLSGRLTDNAPVDAIAAESLALITRINSEIAYADATAGFKTADVADAFFTYSTTRVTAPRLGGSAQRNLVVLCSDTYACAKPPQGPNVHPDRAGYAVMARAYETAVGRI